eukprot:SM000121S26024  [mRNA]  locus=s121:298001:312953:- [translate_table: standard]
MAAVAAPAGHAGPGPPPDGLEAVAVPVPGALATLPVAPDGLALELAGAMHAADVLEEIGYSCTASVRHCRDVLGLFPDLREAEIARLVAMVARTHTGLEDAHGANGILSSALALHSMPADAGILSSWNLDVLLETIKQLAPNADWALVVQGFDHEGFVVPDQKAFALLVTIVVTASSTAFPVMAVCGGLWKNLEGQLSFLRHAVAAAPDLFSFAETPRRQAPVEGLHGHKSPMGTPNQAWLSVDLIEVLCQLAEAGHVAAIRAILDYPLKHCPEVLLLTLAQVKTPWNLIQSDIMAYLLPTYLSNNPNSSTLLHALWPLNPEAIIRVMVEVHAKDTSSISRLLDVCQDLKVLTIMLEAAPFPFAIDLAALASRREYLNLEKWLNDSLKVNGDALYKACLNYIREKLLAESRSDGTDQRSGPNINLSLETTAMLFKVLQDSSNQPTSQDLVDDQKNLHTAALRAYPRLQAVGVPEQGVTESPFPLDIENEANSYFQKIYVGQLTIDDVIDMLKQFNVSEAQREKDIFACMIQSLFDEYRFFPRYPDRELQITAVLFGCLIKHQLVTHVTLGLALRCVLDALRKPLDSRMFQFGIRSLEQFLDRLVEWPQYCNHILQISHLRESHAELVSFVELSLSRVSSSQGVITANSTSSLEKQQAAPQSVATEDASSEHTSEAVSARDVGHKMEESQAEADSSAPHLPEEACLLTTCALRAKRSIVSSAATMPSQPEAVPVGLPAKEEMLYSAARSTAGRPAGAPSRSPGSSGGFGHALNIETLVLAAESRDGALEAPSSDVQDKVAFIVNNISTMNLDQKAKELLDIVKEAFYPWFAQYMVMKRASIEPNFHDLYVKFLDKINSRTMQKEVVKATYENCKVLLRSELIKSSSEERSLLKNLGSWMGKLTIGRNQPLRAKEIDPKLLIIEAYEKGLMIAVIPFTSKILEPCKSSLAYQPPNPWTMGILSLLAEIYSLPGLKMNLKFDVEVLFNNLGVHLKDVKPSKLLRGRQRETEGNPDFSSKDPGILPSLAEAPRKSGVVSPEIHSSPVVARPAASHHPLPTTATQVSQVRPTQPLLNQKEPEAKVHTLPTTEVAPGPSTTTALLAPSTFSPQQTAVAIPNLVAYIVYNSKLAGLSQQLQLQRTVPAAMERAIREIITPVVERSVTIACMTTRELVMKDFAMEAEDGRTQKAANSMVASLAGSLAHVTSKEPLRQALANHLRNLLQGSNLNSEVLEQAVQLITNDNLDLGCAVIEKAATEKALHDLEETLGPALAARKKSREQLGATFYDASIYSQGSLSRLPEALRPKPGRLSATQYRVYEDFARLPWQNQASSVPPQQVAGGAQSIAAPVPPGPTPNPSLRAAAHTSSSNFGPGVLQQGAGQATAPAVQQEYEVQANSFNSTLNQSLVTDAGSRPSQEPIQSYPASAAETTGTGAPTSAQDATGVPEPSLTTGEALDQFKAVFQKLEVALVHSPQATFTALPSEHEIRVLVQEITDVMLQSVTRDEVALAIAQKVFKILYETSNLAHSTIYIAILEHVCDICKLVVKELTSWVIYSHEERKYNKDITVGLIRAELIALSDYSVYLAKAMDGGRYAIATEFAIYLVKTCVIQESVVSAAELYNVIELLGKIAQRPGAPESLQQLVELARSANAAAGQALTANIKDDKGRPSQKRVLAARPAGTKDDAPLPESPTLQQVVVFFDDWARICDLPSGDNAHALYISQLQQAGMLKGDDMSERFFRLLMELAVGHCLSSELSHSSGVTQGAQGLSYTAIDMYGKLICVLFKHCDDNPGTTATSRVNLLNKVLSAAVHFIQRDADERKGAFNPKPYFRLFLIWLTDLNTGDPPSEAVDFQVMTSLGTAFLNLQPIRVPGFSTSQVRVLYKGSLRVLLVLLHDFPEFLCDYHFSFCDVIPSSCIQMRNLILSAFPRNMRLPDPFTPNLKVDLLPEINQPPRILSVVESVLSSKQLKVELDEYLKTRQPASFLLELKSRLLHSQQETIQSGSHYNVALMNAVVLYVGVQAIHQLQSKATPQQLTVQSAPMAHSAPMDIFQQLITDLDAEGRYLFLNAIANQLRYPNNHTHYFSCVLLYLFAEASQEIHREQITRVLLERLIVNRPHPWGLLITFIELIKNPRYNFWNHPFTRCAPEIEKLFESVARSCMGPQQKQQEEELPPAMSQEQLKSL